MADKGSRTNGAGPAPARSTSRASNALSLNIDDNEEDFALAAMGISDSYRPSPAPPTSHYHPVPAASVDMSTAARPSSIAKNHRRHDSLTLRHDGPNGHDGSSTSARTEASSALLSRSSSVSTVSASPFISPEDPYEGPSGPSHPYQMYPQNVRLARTASLATTSTAPVSEQSYSGPRGPTHPYMMYPQNTVPEPSIAEDHSPVTMPANVGFPGSMDRYQRRIGPDGEDAADLIGPDGHTEQLPPYSRYPDEAYHRKALGLGVPTPPVVQPASSQAATSAQAIPGAGGIGRATRNPEFSSTEDLGDAVSPLSRQSVRSFASEPSQHEVNTAAAAVADEKAPPRGWKQTARKRVWGVVPCWAVGLAVLVLVLMGVVVGAVIGSMFGSRLKLDDTAQDPKPSMADPDDWEPLDSIPDGTPPLITGDFGLPLMLSNTASQCVKNTTQAQAWNCNMIYSQLGINITQIPKAPATEAYSISFSYNDSFTMDDYVYAYGMQPPKMKGETLRLVTDLYQDDRGPAWSFKTEYLKTVIIPEELLYPSTTTTKRGSGSFQGDFFSRGKAFASPGEKPWFCYWDQTVFEAFIYVTQNNSLKAISNNDNSSSSSSSSSISSSTSSSRTTTTSSTRTTKLGDAWWTSPPSGLPGTPPPPHDNNHLNSDYGVPSNERRGSAPQPTVFHRDASSASDHSEPAAYSNLPKSGSKPPHPNVIKILERRIKKSEDTGFCQQFEIRGPGQEALPVLVEGRLIKISLNESFPTLQSSSRARDVIESYLAERAGDGSSGTEMSDCGCMWWLN
ncbi:uncharacterized protein B0I36DRAFT_328115 [Microdochium trichocladiopsis]|uniref:DUF7820 domain-containing protein n=1 Tax=Microdochium trichocladiopsis TaxID=1682393 RepID=A0A9P9BNM2_9PEZI|nr:uncharacterized protein B0I36DRAFT_328115 [Microdochium trichocladiopsis]KAH7027881.1 hypothetical protein B0I36DRAFT_328115 [Microdochium trichocladiopsis]